MNDIERLDRASIGGRTSQMLDDLQQVTIGAVNGLAVGGAVVFLACMDMRLAAESAWFSIPEVELDLPLTWQALPRLMRELGPARTKELVMACERFTAQQALDWGFVNHVHPDADLIPEARKLAARLLSMDPLSLAIDEGRVQSPGQPHGPRRSQLVRPRDDAARLPPGRLRAKAKEK